MEHFISEWKYFNEQVSNAMHGNSILCSLDPMFCDSVIMKAIKITAAPVGGTTDINLDQLCGKAENGNFYALYNIEEKTVDNQKVYEIELACTPKGDLPAHYRIIVSKTDFDNYLAKVMSYFDPNMNKKVYRNEILFPEFNDNLESEFDKQFFENGNDDCY